MALRCMEIKRSTKEIEIPCSEYSFFFIFKVYLFLRESMTGGGAGDGMVVEREVQRIQSRLCSDRGSERALH